MRFECTKPDNGSYEKPKPGKYIGVIVGFAYVGTQPGGQYDPKKKIMLRWELFKRTKPSLDDAGHPHTVTATFGATIRGDKSLLRNCLESHGMTITEGQTIDSEDFLGKAAWLDLQESSDGKWINVDGISRLDPEDDTIPKASIPPEHWVPDNGTTCPGWAAWAVARSLDLAHLAPERKAKPKEADTASVAEMMANDDIPF